MPDVLIVPPFRTPLLTANGVPLSALDAASGDKSAGGPPGNRTTIETTRDWWLYWRTLAEFANAGVNMLTYGNSFDRPDAGGMPDGAIYVNADQSGVIYQNQGGEWHYLAGTMYGTISPDERPSDLGVNDAGFEFRSIDTDPLLGGHHWIWSGSAWVEITPNRYGGHASRLSQPLADTWNGMLWVETDRSGVIYQNQSGVWHFLAGTMWGTLSPDQRPTDLGINDAGFTFRATDQARAFVWSGTAWVEVTVPPAVSQTPWTSNIDAAGFQLLNAGRIGIGTSGPSRSLDISGGAAFRSVSGPSISGNITLDATNRSMIVMSQTAATTVQGISGGVDGALLFVLNGNNPVITFAHLGPVAAQDQILIRGSININLPLFGVAVLVYSSFGRWAMVTPTT